MTESYQYFFNGDEVSVVKINCCTPLWFAFDKETEKLTPLTFSSMTSEEVNGEDVSVRLFEEGELRFCAGKGDFTLYDYNTSKIVKECVEEIPERLQALIKEFGCNE